MAIEIKNPYTNKPINNPYNKGTPNKGLPGTINESGVIIPNANIQPNKNINDVQYETLGGAQSNEDRLADLRRQVLIRAIQNKVSGAGTGTGVSPVNVASDNVVSTSDSARAADDLKLQETAKSAQEQTAAQDAEIAKLKRENEIKALKDSLGISEPVKQPTLAADYEKLLTERGVTQTESAIRDIDAQIQALDLAQQKANLNIEAGLESMGQQSNRKAAMQEQAAIQRASLQLKKSILVDELSTKQNIVNNIMKLKGEDYANSVADYNTKFNQAVQLNSVLAGYKTKEEAEANRVRDDARANANLMINSVKGTGKSWDSLDADVRVGLQKIALQSGIDEAVFKEIINNAGVSEIISTQSGYDADGNEVISFIVKDANGNPKILNQIKTGTVASKTIDSADTSSTIFESSKTGKKYDMATVEGIRNYKNDLGLSWVDMSAVMDQNLSKLDATTRQKLLNQAGMGQFIDDNYMNTVVRSMIDGTGGFERDAELVKEMEGGAWFGIGVDWDKKVSEYVNKKYKPEVERMRSEGMSDTDIAKELFTPN